MRRYYFKTMRRTFSKSTRKSQKAAFEPPVSRQFNYSNSGEDEKAKLNSSVHRKSILISTRAPDSLSKESCSSVESSTHEGFHALIAAASLQIESSSTCSSPERSNSFVEFPDCIATEVREPCSYVRNHDVRNHAESIFKKKTDPNSVTRRAGSVQIRCDVSDKINYMNNDLSRFHSDSGGSTFSCDNMTTDRFDTQTAKPEMLTDSSPTSVLTADSSLDVATFYTRMPNPAFRERLPRWTNLERDSSIALSNSSRSRSASFGKQEIGLHNESNEKAKTSSIWRHCEYQPYSKARMREVDLWPSGSSTVPTSDRLNSDSSRQINVSFGPSQDLSDMCENIKRINYHSSRTKPSTVDAYNESNFAKSQLHDHIKASTKFSKRKQCEAFSPPMSSLKIAKRKKTYVIAPKNINNLPEFQVTASSSDYGNPSFHEDYCRSASFQTCCESRNDASSLNINEIKNSVAIAPLTQEYSPRVMEDTERPLLKDDHMSSLCERQHVDQPSTLWIQTSNSLQSYFTGCIPLSLSKDSEWLSDVNCYVRKYCIVAFSATENDVLTTSKRGRICLGQVGIRCQFCYKQPLKYRAIASVSFPVSISGIYESVKRWQRVHLPSCTHVPVGVKSKIADLQKNCAWVPTTRQYWSDSAKALGMVDTSEGIRFERDPAEPSRAEEFVLSISSIKPQALLRTEDKSQVPPYVYTLIEQVQTCQFTEADRFLARSKCLIGFPGFECRHCAGHAGLGKYFPTTAKSLSTNSTSQNIHSHLMKCRRCPNEIKEKLEQLKDSKSRYPGLTHGWRRIFFDKIWARLHHHKTIPT